MKQEDNDVGSFFAILGWFLLPFVAIFRWLKKSSEDMSENQKILFYGLFILLVLGFIDAFTGWFNFYH